MLISDCDHGSEGVGVRALRARLRQSPVRADVVHRSRGLDVRVVPFGERAVLAELDDLDAVHELHRRVRAAALPGVEDLVPAACTLLLAFDPALVSARDLARSLAELAQRPAGVFESQYRAGAMPGEAGTVQIPVRYDGPDLAVVAELSGLTQAEVISRHSRAVYTVAFCGFAPGFAYLRGLDPALAVPRRDSPRARVPAGAVAVADAWTAVYPAASPGGWRILGHTQAALWRVDRDPPTPLQPGTRVRFKDLG